MANQQLLSSQIAIVEEQPNIVAIQGAPEAVGMLTTTERGPVGVATMVTSDPEYRKVFGSYTANTDGGLSAKGFFENGGDGVPLWVTRTVHYSDPTDATTKTSAAATFTLLTAVLSAAAGVALSSLVGPYVLSAGDTIVSSIDGGGTQTTTFSATAAQRASGAGTFALSDGQTLLVAIDGGSAQTITFHTSMFVSIGAATRAEVAAAINGQIVGASAQDISSTVRITSDTQGTGSGVNVSGGSANGALGFATGNVAGTGNVANIKATTAAEVVAALGAVVTGAVVALDGTTHTPKVTSNTTGGSSSVQLTSGGVAAVKVGFDNATHTGNASGAVSTLTVSAKTDGSYGNAVQVQKLAPTNGEANSYNLVIFAGGRAVEQRPNLSTDPLSPAYGPGVVNDPSTGSDYIHLTDLFPAVSLANAVPATGTVTLAGGNDGLSGLADADYIGSANLGLSTGLRAFDNVSDLRVLVAPNRATAAVHNAMITYCEATRFGSCFAILDPPANNTAAQIVNYVVNTAALYGLSEFAAIYWPRVKIANPSTAIYGTSATLTVAPSALIAGTYMRNDAVDGGIYEAPAGIGWGDLTNVTGVENALGVGEPEVNDVTKRNLVYPKLINPIRGTPVRLDGARTLKDTSNFPTIGERRGVIFIEQSLKEGLEFARFRKIKTGLFAAMDRSGRKFLRDQTKLGAFASDDPKAAFLLDLSKGQNTAATAFARTVFGKIGLATAKPAEFIVLRVGQDTRALEAELAAA